MFVIRIRLCLTLRQLRKRGNVRSNHCAVHSLRLFDGISIYARSVRNNREVPHVPSSTRRAPPICRRKDTPARLRVYALSCDRSRVADRHDCNYHVRMIEFTDEHRIGPNMRETEKNLLPSTEVKRLEKTKAAGTTFDERGTVMA